MNKVKIMLLLLSVMIFASAGVHAQSNGLSLSPAYSEVSLSEGDKTSIEFTLNNNDDSVLNFDVNIATLKEGNLTTTDQFNSWLSLSSSAIFSVDKQSSKTIDAQINIPKDTAAGIYEPVIVFTSHAAQEESAASNAVDGQITLNIAYRLKIIVNSSEQASKGIQISSFSLGQNIIIGNSINADLSVKNNPGTLISKPLILFQIIDPLGTIIYKTTLNESLNELSVDQSFTDKANANIPFSKLSDIGVYKAELLATDTLTNNSDFKKVTFYYLPYQAVICALILLALVIICAILTKRRLNKPKQLDHPLEKKLKTSKLHNV